MVSHTYTQYCDLHLHAVELHCLVCALLIVGHNIVEKNPYSTYIRPLQHTPEMRGHDRFGRSALARIQASTEMAVQNIVFNTSSARKRRKNGLNRPRSDQERAQKRA